MIPENFLSSGVSTADVVADDPVYHIDLGNLHNDDTIVAGNKSKTYCLNKVDNTVFYDDSPWDQMDSGASVSITNLVSLLHNKNSSTQSTRVMSVCMVLLQSKSLLLVPLDI